MFDLSFRLLSLKFKNATKQDSRRAANQDHLPADRKSKIPRSITSPIKAIDLLSYELQFCPRSRSMSLLNSARVYEQLSKFYPEVTEYKLYLAQSHYKNGDFDQALKVTQSINDAASQQKVILLQSVIRYEQD
jgi:hypothetical protein